MGQSFLDFLTLIGKRPLECVLGSTSFLHEPFHWKVSPFPRVTKETGAILKRTRVAVWPSFLALLKPSSGRPFFWLQTTGRPETQAWILWKEHSRAGSDLHAAREARATRGGRSAGERGKGDSPDTQSCSLNNVSFKSLNHRHLNL